VSKNGLILTSLVGAIPGAVMAALMVLAFGKYAGGPSILHKLLCGMALLIGLLLAAMPIGIFVLTGPKAEKAPAKKKKEEVGEELVEAQSSEAVEVEDSAVTDENLEIEEGPPDEFAVTGEVVTKDALADSSEFDIEQDEEESPRKGKK
jgi:hypothetical protein